ncbi:peptidoglycan DD-metalloendopeptidase family protein [Flavobacterium subsaxonicum]|uniref:peptidoglycan DD-metalloendopeptidase family protein n=1 Tax=Flavobacterium subsaxonicum TaxID=426226 RepID=UPI000406E6FA|nr:M23 family metallopeptidase [Flavobacterium subsaxonicum]
MKRNNLIYTTVAAVALLLIISCSGLTQSISTGFTKVADAVTNPTARQVYAREFNDNKTIYTEWDIAYNTAKAYDSLQVTLPYGEKGVFTPNSNAVYTYTVQLQEGEVLQAAVAADSVNQRMFIDVLAQQDTAYVPVLSTKIGEASLEYEVPQTGFYKVIIQPELAANSNFFISLSKRPLYVFPVSGKGNAAIGSFWGMERDGGKRSHEGIDIFAKRGTPVVAITNGSVSYTGEKGLGGKQVWLRDGLFGKSLYYAHLDSIAVQTGASVKTGDTLGFVGNTGNAKFTPPHLHFGIYKSGAVNPLPYVYQIPKVTPAQFTRSFAAATLKTKGKANLRQGPSTSAPTVGALSPTQTVTLLGQHNDWLHIQTPTGQKAFLHKSLAKAIN